MTSNIKTLFLLALLSSIIMFIGQAMGGSQGLVIAFGFAILMNIGSFWFSDSIVLKAYKAQELSEAEAPMLHRMVEELCHEAGIPKPRIYAIPDDSPNAFATGRSPSHAAVAVTRGIIRILSPAELRGVIAHEIGHIANRDILIQSVAGILAMVIMYAANMMQWAAIFGGGRSDEREGSSNAFTLILMAVLAPLAASLIQFAISRSREYLADATGAKLCKEPKALASALQKLTLSVQQQPMHTGNQATAHMFIVNPFASQLKSLFSTHPPVEERVRRLQQM